MKPLEKLDDYFSLKNTPKNVFCKKIFIATECLRELDYYPEICKIVDFGTSVATNTKTSKANERPDISSDQYVCEVKYGKKWRDAIGQIQNYALNNKNRQPVLILIVDGEKVLRDARNIGEISSKGNFHVIFCLTKREKFEDDYRVLIEFLDDPVKWVSLTDNKTSAHLFANREFVKFFLEQLENRDLDPVMKEIEKHMWTHWNTYVYYNKECLVAFPSDVEVPPFGRVNNGWWKAYYDDIERYFEGLNLGVLAKYIKASSVTYETGISKKEIIRALMRKIYHYNFQQAINTLT